MNNHHNIVLLGDSIFDNASYVPLGKPVSKHLQKLVKDEAEVTLCAVDGHTSYEVPDQMRGIPDDASHLFLSVGGNDALMWKEQILGAVTADEVFTLLRKAQLEFERSYDEAVRAAKDTGLPLWVCTIYRDIPGLDDALQAPLAIFNDVITGTVNRMGGVGLIDLRTVCTESGDYSILSPIEPSHKGGKKIAKAIAEAYWELN